MTSAAKPPSFYADFAGLAALKKSAVQQDPKALREAARQFESLFTQMMLKSMRAANSMTTPGDPLTGSDQSNFYRDMYDSQLAVQMSKGKGLGLADMLVKQLSVSGELGTAGATTKGATSLATSQTNIGANAYKSTQAMSEKSVNAKTMSQVIDAVSAGSDAEPVVNGSVKPFSNEAIDWCADGEDPGASAVDTAKSNSAKRGDNVSADKSVSKTESAPESVRETTQIVPSDISPADFLRQMWPHAVATARELGVDPHTLLAHAALETGWGKYIPCNADGTCSNNLFGIKAGSQWQGAAVNTKTLEYEHGVAVTRSASFRAYQSPADSFRDYAKLLKSNPRYVNALNTGTNAAAFGAALQQAGYATDPQYASKLAATAATVQSLSTHSLQAPSSGMQSSDMQASPQIVLKTAEVRSLTLGRGAT